MEKSWAERIQFWIDNRLLREDYKPYNCLFSVLVLNEEKKDEIVGFLNRIAGKITGPVDTIPGCWNLNDDWYEIDDVECIVEYCGVYPIHWDINDVVYLRELYKNRDVYIHVEWKEVQEDGSIKYIPNN